jgi:hypothetical protein
VTAEPPTWPTRRAMFSAGTPELESSDTNLCLPVAVPVDAVLQLAPEHLDCSRKQAVEGLDPEKWVPELAIWALRCGSVVSV